MSPHVVCGGTKLGEHWPWEAKELNPWEPFNETTFPSYRKNIWLLKSSIIRKHCISYPKVQFTTPVGYLTCLGQKFYNGTSQKTQWWGTLNHIELNRHSLANFSGLQAGWGNLIVNID
jgi:hypothetical protein